MTNQEVWNEFLDNLVSNAIEDRRNSKEYEHQKQRREQIDEFLSTNLTADQKASVKEILYEFELAAERNTEVIFRQGLIDCVWMLKNLGVIT